MIKLVSIGQLATFKAKQDTANENKFMQINNFVDENGLIKSEKIQVTAGVDVIKMHVDSSDADNVKYFIDNNGAKGDTEISGETGKIYIDMASGGEFIYTFNGTNFIPYASQIASTADIEELFNE